MDFHNVFSCICWNRLFIRIDLLRNWIRYSTNLSVEWQSKSGHLDDGLRSIHVGTIFEISFENIHESFISSFPFEENQFVVYFGKAFSKICVASGCSILMATFTLIPIGTCMCFEACLDDLIKEFQDVELTGILLKSDFVDILQFQIDCIA